MVGILSSMWRGDPKTKKLYASVQGPCCGFYWVRASHCTRIELTHDHEILGLVTSTLLYIYIYIFYSICVIMNATVRLGLGLPAVKINN
jgi:hypothetical protein